MNNKASILFFILTVLVSLIVEPVKAENDPFADIDKLLDNQFEDIDRSLEEQYQLLDAALEQGFKKFSSEVQATWGEKETLLPSKKQWVGYSTDLKTRSVVDFASGVIKIERIVAAGEEQLTVISDMNAAATALSVDTMADLDAKDQSLQYAKEILAAEDIELPASPDPDPFLANITGPIDSEKVSGIVSDLLSDDNKSHQDELSGTMTELDNSNLKLTVTIPLSENYEFKLANQYYAQISAEAEKRHLPASLVFAVVETESAFNPRARSGVPAFGLMQLVPSSGAMDAYEFVYGDKILLGPEYLYEANKNVELGAAYLDILHNRYLRHITNPRSREYCAIAAYNTGAGNVAKSFIGNTSVKRAAKVINAMPAEQVYTHLIENLPYEETRHYLEKVTRAKKKYAVYDKQAQLSSQNQFLNP